MLRPEVAYIMTSFMRDVVNRGTAARLRGRGFKFNVAGKTGTSRDGWFAGYTPKLVCAVWVGFDDNAQLGLTGADSALPIWADFMSAALNSHPEWQGDWEMPAGVEQVEIDARTGMLPAAAVIDENGAPVAVKRRTEIFISGTAPATESEEFEALEGVESELPEGPVGETDLALPDAPEVFTEDVPPDPTPRPRTSAPRLEGRGVTQPDGTSRLLGTITLDIDPTTGLLAAPTCPVIRSKTFQIGQEPRRYCGPEYHNSKTIQPSATRPRIMN
ncbi:MAG: hypothetical protein M3371_13940 [Acidobacteriota bacterium]|nr:hypothetical protein [Acidobacteriota bacterium]